MIQTIGHSGRRRLCLLVLAAAVLCRGAASLAADAPEGRKKLVFWNLFTAGTRHAAVTELIRRFNERNGEYFVEQVDIPYGQIHAKMLPAIAGRVPPDVAVFDRFRVASYAARNAFLPLEELAKRDGVLGEDFFQAPWEECLYAGRLYAVPYDTDTRVLYYNRTLFREAGLDPNRPPKTWSELREYSRKLTRRRPNGRLEQVGYVPIEGNVGSLYLYGWQKGGRFLSEDGRRALLNTPPNVQALEWVRDFVSEYGLEDVMTLRSGFGRETQNPFVTGKLAMIVWDVGAVDDIRRYGGDDLDWAAAPCPYADDGVPATWSGGFALVVPQGTSHAEGAWAFCKHILSDESQRHMATSSDKLPARRSAANDPFFQDSAFWRLAIDQMKYSRYRPVTPAGSIIATEMVMAVDQVVHGKLSPQQALDAANRQVQKVLDDFHEAEATRGPPVNWLPIGTALGGAALLLLAVRGWFSFRRIRAMSIHRRQALAGYLFALPAILGLALFTLGPIVMSGVYSMTRYEILTPATWQGLGNYRELFGEDRYFLKALWNTFYFAAVSVPINISLALGLALLLNRPIGGRALYRTCFYLPTVMPAVAGSLLWAWLFNGEYGLINLVLEAVGLPPVPWLTSEYCSKPALIVMGMWGVGGGMIIFLAALQGVPRTLYEAAEIDGAGAWRKFRNVTLPMISPAMFFMVVMGLIGALQVFTQAYLVTEGGPVNSTLFYVLYLYREAFENLHMGYAAAMAWVLFLVILVITGVQFVLARRWVYYEGAQR
ncbi:MAG TPA: extracellular solute-binding protein [Phycisphaerae bacterium]|nr:extracellular solute-binding protein [Phycisphaerae bacterium]